jgi:NADH:ubiquinone oxidoreductase subunit F (NADH-binding)
VNNVETLSAVPLVVRHGGAAYARLGHPEEAGTKLVCLSQVFRRPGVYEVEFGVPLRHLVDDLGGGLREPQTPRAVQVGGPLGGFLTPDRLDLPLLSRPLAQAGAALGHGSLVAVDSAMPGAAILRHAWAILYLDSFATRDGRAALAAAAVPAAGRTTRRRIPVRPDHRAPLGALQQRLDEPAYARHRAIP